MPALLAATSHSPLTNVEGQAPEDVSAEFRQSLDDLREKVAAFDPELVIQFGNDHNSGFSLGLMPPFLIGLRATGLGDFGTSTGPLLIDEAAGRLMAASLHEAGIDIATGYDVVFDHGIVWALDKLFGGIDRVPVVPIFINCGGDLRPPFHRAHALGTAVGEIAKASFGDTRILFIASGGLSHDPPLPIFESAPPDVQEKMIAGTEWDEESLRQRTLRVAQAGKDHAAGGDDLLPLNPEWDNQIIAKLEAGDLEWLAQMDDAEVIRLGGRGGSEVRNWLAGFAALKAYGGDYTASKHYYNAVKEWIAGFTMMHARAA
ncbi:3-carboxyethylcatechol 2,3-dioxygenase [Parasphingopyxis algicola]|uniref:3-carboxyethylcatechol 2,3-dioxygenase n=1 Tax=Parasphingopyxis algicola TaxID=2026624 RepID=UPI0015A3569D|nr:3-carboxyethylcatechol 2,3-dioxygenase [Parasphingopyxis algicola]QLC26496.1 3-carboxyethylcatechol 2,3-dioxygenase [Parasphingopyxis algicola]